MTGPRIVIAPDGEQVGRAGARHIDRLRAAGALRTLGVATGSSPLPLYRALATLWRDGEHREHGDLGEHGDLTAFALDEYVGLPSSHPESYHSVVAREVTGPLRLDPERVHVPCGDTDAPDRAAARYEELIRAAGGIDLQILGIGGNGHIGFNEPGSAPDSRTRVVDLADDTRRANARFFETLDDVPRRAVTQGIGTILDARRLLVIVHGAGKAGLLATAFDGPVTAGFPASILQRHPDVTVMTDPVAADGLAAHHTIEETSG